VAAPLLPPDGEQHEHESSATISVSFRGFEIASPAPGSTATQLTGVDTTSINVQRPPD
jgi:hypothetical protein